MLSKYRRMATGAFVGNSTSTTTDSRPSLQTALARKGDHAVQRRLHCTLIRVSTYMACGPGRGAHSGDGRTRAKSLGCVRWGSGVGSLGLHVCGVDQLQQL